MTPQEKIAKVLRTDKDFIFSIEESLGVLSEKKDVMVKITEENENKMSEILKKLDIKNLKADEIYTALIDKLKKDDHDVFELLKRPTGDSEEGCRTMLNVAKELANVGKGFFLKREKAIEFLRNEPPPNTLNFFNFKKIEELLEKFDVLEIYSALRFAEDINWLNDRFFKQLEDVKPEDFEEREIEVHVLHGEWLKVAEAFVKKKYHNVSHLKELGNIFIIPLKIDTPGETMRVFSLILHYLHEVDFYSKLFRHYARGPQKDFAPKLISALKGEVSSKRLSEKDRGKKWMIVQRYLAKDDFHDWRLFEPHINPEAIHWLKAEKDITRLGRRFDKLDIEFWNELDFVGNYFQDASGSEVLVSFNLIDNVMSLVQEKEMIKYLYHHQEALWNKILMEYIGINEIERLIFENFDEGFVDIAKYLKDK
jgi:hypothetical protein